MINYAKIAANAEAVAKEMIANHEKWKLENPEAYWESKQRQQDRQFREQQAARKCIDTTESLATEIRLQKMGY